MVWADASGLPRPSVDAMASQSNAQLSKYVSRRVEPDAWSVDFFSTNFEESDVLFCNPPFALAGQVLYSFCHRRLTGFLLLPLRQTDQSCKNAFAAASRKWGPLGATPVSFLPPRGFPENLWVNTRVNFHFGFIFINKGDL